MTLIASGIFKATAWKKQTALGTPAAGAGGKTARRVTSIFKADRDVFTSNEMVTHRQSTGVSYGLQKADGKISGLLSAGTWSDLFGSILMQNFAVVTPGAAPASTTVAIVSGAVYSLTRTTGSYLTDGYKVGQVGKDDFECIFIDHEHRQEEIEKSIFPAFIAEAMDNPFVQVIIALVAAVGLVWLLKILGLIV